MFERAKAHRERVEYKLDQQTELLFQQNQLLMKQVSLLNDIERGIITIRDKDQTYLHYQIDEVTKAIKNIDLPPAVNFHPVETAIRQGFFGIEQHINRLFPPSRD